MIGATSLAGRGRIAHMSRHVVGGHVVRQTVSQYGVRQNPIARFRSRAATAFRPLQRRSTHLSAQRVLLAPALRNPPNSSVEPTQRLGQERTLTVWQPPRRVVLPGKHPAMLVVARALKDSYDRTTRRSAGVLRQTGTVLDANRRPDAGIATVPRGAPALHRLVGVWYAHHQIVPRNSHIGFGVQRGQLRAAQFLGAPIWEWIDHRQGVRVYRYRRECRAKPAPASQVGSRSLASLRRQTEAG